MKRRVRVIASRRRPGNMWREPLSGCSPDDWKAVDVEPSHSLWTIYLAPALSTSFIFSDSNKQRGKREEWERENEKNKRGRIKWRFMKTVACLTWKALRTQEIALAYFGLRSSGHISDCGMKRERPWGAVMDGVEADHWLLRSKWKNKCNKTERMTMEGHLFPHQLIDGGLRDPVAVT